MTTINTNFKANTADDYGLPPAADLLNTQEELQKILDQMENFEYLEYLSEEQLAEFMRIKMMIKAESAAISGYALTGELPSTIGEEGTGFWDLPTELDPEWNGVPAESMLLDDPYGAGLIDDPDTEFVGSIIIPNSGDPYSLSKIGFQMTDDMDSVVAISKGRDIVVTVKYLDGSKRAWVVKEGTVRREPIIFSAYGVSHGVTIDCSRVIRVSDGTYANYPYGARSGLFIWGSEGDDLLKGSQSDDLIVGLAGKDKIDGGAGNDSICGDEAVQGAAQFDTNYGDSDEIKGGAGYDLIYGGAGNDVVFKSDKGEGVCEEEAWVNDLVNEPPQPIMDWFYSQSTTDDVNGTWDVLDEMEDGMAVIENVSSVGDAGSLAITMPPGYSMAYAEQNDGDDLIITFVGEAGTLKVMVKHFFSGHFGHADGSIASQIVNLTFKDSAEDDIIDFSRVELGNQSLQIDAYQGGDDIILNAHYAALSDGLDMNDLYTSSWGTGLLNSYCDDIFTGDSGAYYEGEVVNGQIVIGDNPNSNPKYYDTNTDEWMEWDSDSGQYVIDDLCQDSWYDDSIGVKSWMEWDGSDWVESTEECFDPWYDGVGDTWMVWDTDTNSYVPDPFYKTGALGIVAPPGFDKFYATYDPANPGDIYLILTDGQGESIVFKVPAELGLKLDEIKVYQTGGQGDPGNVPMVPILLEPDSINYNIDGEDGSDFILTQEGSSVTSDANDYVEYGEFDWDNINSYSYESELGGYTPPPDVDDTDVVDDTDADTDTDDDDDDDDA